MTGLEDSIKGKLFYKTKNGEYGELETSELQVMKTEDTEEYENRKLNTEVEFETTITDKNTIRRLKQLVKADKDKKAEKRFNKKSFRDFISNI